MLMVFSGIVIQEDPLDWALSEINQQRLMLVLGDCATTAVVNSQSGRNFEE
jgi:hypothetical protein